jgi:3-hydroxyisobutyrate dehydrogenase-like beta-hydroxyacid dehydrogenase
VTLKSIALIGFGEVGQVLARDLIAGGHTQITTFDLKFSDPGSKPAQGLKAHAVIATASAAEAVQSADLIISAVTAAQTVAAANAAAKGIKAGAYFLDLNSASPESKQAAAQAIEAVGAAYVEASVMSPIEPRRLTSPILLGGAHAETFAPIIQSLGFTGAKFYSPVFGKASATKLCRSVMIKGLEALISESLLSARYYGVEDEVLSSLNNLFPHPDWPYYARYMISRTLEHGARRSEEMFEAAKTVAGAGLEPLMATATAKRQAVTPAFAAALSADDLYAMLDAIRAQFNDNQEAAQ